MQETVKKILEALEGLDAGASKAAALEAAARECGMAALAIDLGAAQSFLSGDMGDLEARVSAAGADAGLDCWGILVSEDDYDEGDDPRKLLSLVGDDFLDGAVEVEVEERVKVLVAA